MYLKAFLRFSLSYEVNLSSSIGLGSSSCLPHVKSKQGGSNSSYFGGPRILKTIMYVLEYSNSEHPTPNMTQLSRKSLREFREIIKMNRMLTLGK